MDTETTYADVIAYFRGEVPNLCAHLDSKDEEGIARIAIQQIVDGAEQVTVRIDGVEYDPGAWLAYLSGVIEMLVPLPVQRSEVA